MPPRAEDIVVEEATAASSAVDGEQLFASTAKREQSTEEVSSNDTKPKSQKNKTSFSSFLSSVHRDLENLGTSLENGFIECIDRSPLGVNTDDKLKQEDSAARTSSAVSAKKKKKEELSSPWYNDAPEEEGSGDKPTLERKGSSVAKAAKKSAVAVGGGALIGVGVVMIPTLPPPFASLTMLGGYALLGTEFEGPRKVVKNARDKMRDIKDDDGDDEENKGEDTKEGETEENNESSSDIEKEFTDGENKKMLQSETETAAEYFGYGRSDTGSTSDQRDNNNKNDKKKKKNPVKKTAQKLSKKYVLPALEKVCSAYEKFEDKDQVAKEEGFEVVKDEAGDEETVSKVADKEQLPAAPKGDEEEKGEAKDDQQEPADEVPASTVEEKKEDGEEEEFVDAKEDWIDIDEDTDATATDESEDDAVLV